MKKTKKDDWVQKLLNISLVKQQWEQHFHKEYKVPFMMLSAYSMFNIRTGMILERLKQRKIKDGVGRLSLSQALKKATKATEKLREAINEQENIKDKN